MGHQHQISLKRKKFRTTRLHVEKLHGSTVSHQVPGVHIDSLLFDLSVSRRDTGARALALAGLKPSQGSIERRKEGGDWIEKVMEWLGSLGELYKEKQLIPMEVGAIFEW